MATPVKTANCGFLKTLGHGSVCFHIHSAGRSCTFVLKDCLHAPDAPINLLSVGTLQEKGATSPGLTSVLIPSSHSTVLAFSFNAVILHCLSFLNCNFVLSSPSTPIPLSDPSFDHDAALLASFPEVSLTPELWHRCFGHLGKAATQAVITKDYVTGVTSTGNFEKLHCVACLIGELLHIDVCSPFPTLTPQKHSSFINYQHS